MTARRVMGTEVEYGISVPGQPNANHMLLSAQVVNAKLTPEAAAKQLQDGLDKWYKPAK